MSSVIFSTAVSHHCESFSRRCSVVSLAGSPSASAAAPPPAASAASASRQLGVRVVPDLVEIAVAAQHGGVAPVQRPLRPRRVEDGEAHGVGAIALDELVGVDHVAQMLAHLAPAAYDHLVKEAAGEGLAVGDEGQRADVAQRLGHGALVEDEVAAVRAGDQALGGQPVAQVGQREDLLQRLLAVLRRHARRQPQPERVEVAVQRVGLPPRRPAAGGAGRLHELLQLGQRIAGAGGAQVERQQHGQLLAGHGHRAALLAVDDRDRRAPGALARDREVEGAVAHGLAGPQRARAAVLTRCGLGSLGSGRRLRREAQPAGYDLVDAVVRRDPQHGGDAETGVDQGGDDHRQRPSAGADRRAAGVDQGDRLGLARAALPAAGAQVLKTPCARPGRRPTRRRGGGAGTSARSGRARARPRGG